MNRNWREASTLILIALTKKHCRNNYTVLTVKRSSRSSFMPNGIVFPGGNTHVTDNSKEWLTFFPEPILQYHKSIHMKETPLIIANSKHCHIPKLLALKITAIRETFEEVGILLCLKKDGGTTGASHWASYSTFPDLQQWRATVQEDPRKFITLCRHYDCYPDVNSLHLWSNWLTPVSAGKRRYDTLFLVGFLQEIPQAEADSAEIESFSWLQADLLVKSYRNRSLWLPPPQFYELSRLLQYPKVEILQKFALDRNQEGCQRWMPQVVHTLDGSVSLLPGDDAYNATDFCTPRHPEKISQTAKEFRTSCKVLHRMEFTESSTGTIIVDNYEPANRHVLPAV